VKQSKTHKHIVWGEDSNLFGPKDWFRNSLIIKELQKYSKGHSILDYGCGSGILLKRLDELGYSLTGIDVSKTNISNINKIIEKFARKPKLISGIITSLKNESNTYDGIVCGETLEHIRNDREMVMNFQRLLKPKGICIVTVPSHRSRFNEIDRFAGHYRRYEKKELTNMFELCGFSILQIYSWDFPLGLLWDKYISEPILRKKLDKQIIFTKTNNVFGRILRLDCYPKLKALLSNIFWFDLLWSWTDQGNGLILVAQNK